MLKSARPGSNLPPFSTRQHRYHQLHLLNIARWGQVKDRQAQVAGVRDTTSPKSIGHRGWCHLSLRTVTVLKEAGCLYPVRSPHNLERDNCMHTDLHRMVPSGPRQ